MLSGRNAWSAGAEIGRGGKRAACLGARLGRRTRGWWTLFFGLRADAATGTIDKSARWGIDMAAWCVPCQSTAVMNQMRRDLL